MADFIFKDNNITYNLLNNNKNTPLNLMDLKKYDRKEKRFSLKDLFKLTKNINKLQDNLMESLNFHNEFL